MDDLQNSDIPAQGLISEPVQLSPVPPQHGVFVGRFGLRAGWGIAIYVLLFAIFSVILSLASLAATGKLKTMIADRQAAARAQKSGQAAPAPKPIKPPADMRPKPALIGEGLQFVALALAAWIIARIERRRTAVYGIGKYRLRDFLPGAFWGLASLSVLVGLLRAFHLLIFDGRALSGAAIYVFGAKWLLVFLFVGLLEEYLMRGYLQYTLSRGFFGLAERISPAHSRAVAFWIASTIMSVLFAAGHLHNAGENFMGILMVFVAGITFSYALWRTGSLWWAIGFHMAWDWAQSFLWGVPDSGNLSAGRLFLTHPVGNILLSGGADGPEGSVLVIPILLLVLIVIRLTSPGVQPTFEPIPKPESHPTEGSAILA